MSWRIRALSRWGAWIGIGAARPGHVVVRADVSAQIGVRQTPPAGCSPGAQGRRPRNGFRSNGRRAPRARRARWDPRRMLDGRRRRRLPAGSWFASSHASPCRIVARGPGVLTRDWARVQRTIPLGMTWPAVPRSFLGGDATIALMTTRRDARQTHVRPRPPSTGRPRSGQGASQDAGADQTRASTAPSSVATACRSWPGWDCIAAVALLGSPSCTSVRVGWPVWLGGISASLGGFITSVTASPTPRPTVIADQRPADPGQQPEEPYTAEATVDLIVTVPSDVTGDPDSVIRVYRRSRTNCRSRSRMPRLP